MTSLGIEGGEATLSPEIRTGAPLEAGQPLLATQAPGFVTRQSIMHPEGPRDRTYNSTEGAGLCMVDADTVFVMRNGQLVYS